MRFQNREAGSQSEEEAFAPPTRGHRQRRVGVLSGQLVVEGEHHGLLAGEIAVEERGADACLGRHVTERGPVVTALSHESYCRMEQPPAGLQALSRCSLRPTPTAWYLWLLDVFNKHVY